jgi:hypothetical protein
MPAQYPANAGNPGIIGTLETGLPLGIEIGIITMDGRTKSLPGVCVHGPELDDPKRPPLTTYPVLQIKDRSRGIKFHPAGNHKEQGGCSNKKPQAQNDIHTPLDDPLYKTIPGAYRRNRYGFLEPTGQKRQ